MPRAKKTEPVSRTSAPIADDQLSCLRHCFPEAFTEGKVDMTKLRDALGDVADERSERYSFTWAGKKNAIRLLQVPSRATLIPAKKESVNFDEAQHLFIEGDNLEVLKLLYKPYFGRVKMIYLDPPYNTGNDFIYPDNYADPLDTYLKLTGQKDTNGNLLTSNPETNGRYHSSWLSMMYPRLFLARQLLQDDGVIFVSIDDNEVHNLRLIMNEIFGEENFIDCLVWKKRYGGGAKEKYLVTLHEYILFYGRNKELLDNIFVPLDPEAIERYYTGKDEKFEIRGGYRTHPLEATRSVGIRKNLVYPIPAPDGMEVLPKRQWWWEKERTMRTLANGELEFLKDKDGNWTVHTKQYLRDENGNERVTKAFSVIDDIYTQHGTGEIEEVFGDSRIFSFPKPSQLISKLIEVANVGDHDIILDFFAGSASTAQAILNFNREQRKKVQFLLVQLPEQVPSDSHAYEQGYRTIADIGKERIRRVLKKLKSNDGFRVFKLAESNYRPWTGVPEATPEAYVQQMEAFVDPLVEGWKPENLIHEVALKEGYSLNLSIEKAAVKGQTVHVVTDREKNQNLRICLDDKVALGNLKLLKLQKDDLFVCRAVALDDNTAANLALQCRLKTI